MFPKSHPLLMADQPLLPMLPLKALRFFSDTVISAVVDTDHQRNLCIVLLRPIQGIQNSPHGFRRLYPTTTRAMLPLIDISPVFLDFWFLL